MDLSQFLRDAICEVCDLPSADVGPDSRLDDLGIDSLAVAEIIVLVEMRLDREFPMHVLRHLDAVETVDDVARQLGAFITTSADAGHGA